MWYPAIMFLLSQVGKESEENSSAFVWINYGSQAEYTASMKSAASGPLMSGVGVFRAAVVTKGKGCYPAMNIRNNAKGKAISVSFVVDRKQIEQKSKQLLQDSPGKRAVGGGSSSLKGSNKSASFPSGDGAAGSSGGGPASSGGSLGVGGTGGATGGGKKANEIEQALAVTGMIPNAFQHWDELAITLALGSQDLETGFKLFGVLGNRGSRPTLTTRRLAEEIRLLQNTTTVVSKRTLEQLKTDPRYSRKDVNDLSDPAEWSEVAIGDVKELRLLERLMLWLPGILKFLQVSNKFLFPNSNPEDAYVKELVRASNVVSSSRSSWVLGNVRHEVTPFKKYLDGIDPAHQDFISTFVSRREALLWLLTHTENDAFDKKIRLVRPCTDDEVLLRALNNLSELRRSISELFYKAESQQAAIQLPEVQQGTPAIIADAGVAAPASEEDRIKLAALRCRHYSSLRSFLDYYVQDGIKFTVASADRGSIPMPEDLGQDGEPAGDTEQLSSLRVVTASWDRLSDLLERNTLSPGVKACHEVRPMMQNGIFLFQGTQDTNLQLICRIRNVPKTGEVGAPGQLEEELEYTDVRFEQLAETRRLLLMTEPPEETSKNGAAGVGGEDEDDDDMGMVDAAADDVAMGDIASVQEIFLDQGYAAVTQSKPEQKKVLSRWRKMSLKDLVEEFVRKLEVLEDIRHLIADLHSNGHFEFAHGVVLQILPTESIAEMRAKKAELARVLNNWLFEMRDIRRDYYCLNFFVVKHLQSLRDDFRGIEARFSEKGCLPLRPQYLESGELEQDMIAMLLHVDAADLLDGPADRLSASQSGVLPPTPSSQQLSSSGPVVTHTPTQAGALLQIFDRLLGVSQYISGEAVIQDSVIKLVLTGQLFTEDADRKNLVLFTHTLIQTFDELGRFPHRSATEQIHYIGKLLDECFGKQPWREKKVAWIKERGDKIFSGKKLQQGDLLIQDTNFGGTKAFASVLAEEGGAAVASSTQPPRIVEDDAEQKRAVPIFACTTASEDQVVGLVLSVYFRRERLPDPQEVLLCTELTTPEEIEIVIRRFIQARQYKREKCVYCIGNIQLLSYHVQCRAVETLGVLLGEYGTDDAAALVLVAGSPNQMLITAATSQCGVQYINVSALSDHELQLCLKHAVPSVSGAYCKAINGSGKTDYILRESFQIQKKMGHTKSVYRKLSIRENTDKGEVIDAAMAISLNKKLDELDDEDFLRRNYQLKDKQPQWVRPVATGEEGTGDKKSAALPVDGDGDTLMGGGDKQEVAWAAGGAVASSSGAPGVTTVSGDYDHVIHLDLAHVVQKRTNIVLFELLCLGCIMDAASSKLYFRNPRDRYIVEIPATPGNALLKQLSVLSLLKKEHLTVKAEELKLDRPQFLMTWYDPENSYQKGPEQPVTGTKTQLLQIVENRDILMTCKFLRALKLERFMKSPEEDKNAQQDKTLLAETISPEECWEILEEKTCRREMVKGEEKREEPSWLTFSLFCRFMRNQFERTMAFALLQSRLSRHMGLHQLRHYFCDMLVSTSADFSLRQVPKFHSMDKLELANAEEAVLAELSPKRSTAGTPNSAVPPTLALIPGQGTSSAAPPPGQSPQSSAGLQRATSSPGDGFNPALQRTSSRGSSAAGPSMVRSGSASSRQNMVNKQVDKTARRDMSQQEVMLTELGRERMGAGKVTSSAMVERFLGMVNWESRDHPLSVFKLARAGKVSGIDIISLNRETVEKNWRLDRQFTRSLDNNGLKVFKDWSLASAEECQKLVRMAKGLTETPESRNAQMMGGTAAPPSAGTAHQTLGKTHYVLTIDNLLKILSILLRIEYGVPAIVMGETGCGKTALVEYICDMLRFPLMKIDLHGGVTDADVTKFFRKCMEKAKMLRPDEYLIAFLDEINAANCMAHCKTLIVDRFVDNERLPSNIRIVACCNPYRLRRNRQVEETGLVYQYHFADGGIIVHSVLSQCHLHVRWAENIFPVLRLDTSSTQYLPRI